MARDAKVNTTSDASYKKKLNLPSQREPEREDVAGSQTLRLHWEQRDDARSRRTREASLQLSPKAKSLHLDDGQEGEEEEDHAEDEADGGELGV